MNHALFIHKDAEFRNRIQNEAGSRAWITPSMQQALALLQNPSNRISGVFLNPNDPSFSALTFIEKLHELRPATPLFLIDSEHEIYSEEQKSFLETSNIRAVFRGQESFSQFMEPLNFETTPALLEIRERVTSQSNQPVFLMVPIVDFLSSNYYPFDVFTENDQKKLVLFATAASPIDLEYLSIASKKNPFLYVSESALRETQSQMKETQNKLMKYERFPRSWKTAETLYKTKLILRELAVNGASDRAVEGAQRALSDLFLITSELPQGPDLYKLLDLAKSCDRNITCVTLSLLMCKQLKFERHAILEILGLASLFQDVSLYQSPYGDLSALKPHEMTSDALKYYREHPLLSADLVSRHTKLPDITLQVIRQQHEKKDRTGFPNRVGGMQLHPMSEILSLINAYLDCVEAGTSETEIYHHYSDRMVMALKTILKVSDNFRMPGAA